MKKDDRIPFSVIVKRFKELGLENEDFPVQLTVGDVKTIEKAAGILENIAEITETIQSKYRLAKNVINSILYQYRYEEYIKHYPEDKDMIAERDDEKAKLMKNKDELNDLDEKILNILNALSHDD